MKKGAREPRVNKGPKYPEPSALLISEERKSFTTDSEPCEESSMAPPGADSLLHGEFRNMAVVYGDGHAVQVSETNLSVGAHEFAFDSIAEDVSVKEAMDPVVAAVREGQKHALIVVRGLNSGEAEHLCPRPLVYGADGFAKYVMDSLCGSTMTISMLDFVSLQPPHDVLANPRNKKPQLEPKEVLVPQDTAPFVQALYIKAGKRQTRENALLLSLKVVKRDKSVSFVSFVTLGERCDLALPLSLVFRSYVHEIHNCIEQKMRMSHKNSFSFTDASDIPLKYTSLTKALTRHFLEPSTSLQLSLLPRDERAAGVLLPADVELSSENETAQGDGLLPFEPVTEPSDVLTGSLMAQLYKERARVIELESRYESRTHAAIRVSVPVDNDTSESEDFFFDAGNESSESDASQNSLHVRGSHPAFEGDSLLASHGADLNAVLDGTDKASRWGDGDKDKASGISDADGPEAFASAYGSHSQQENVSGSSQTDDGDRSRDETFGQESASASVADMSVDSTKTASHARDSSSDTSLVRRSTRHRKPTERSQPQANVETPERGKRKRTRASASDNAASSDITSQSGSVYVPSVRSGVSSEKRVRKRDAKKAKKEPAQAKTKSEKSVDPPLDQKVVRGRLSRKNIVLDVPSEPLQVEDFFCMPVDTDAVYRRRKAPQHVDFDQFTEIHL